MLAEGVSAREIAAVISSELDALTGRAGVLAERRMIAEGQGDPPCAYALCVLGSAGRGESLLAMDQDKTMPSFLSRESRAPPQTMVSRLGGIVADILHETGVPYCKGGVMARNAAWRGSRETWRERIADWIANSSPADLFSVDIFFDLAGVHGDAALANELWRAAFDAAQGNAAFAKLLAEAAGEVEPGRTMFSEVSALRAAASTQESRGLFGIVTPSPACSRSASLLERSTPALALAAAALGRGGGPDLDALSRAHEAHSSILFWGSNWPICARRPAAEQQGCGQAADARAARATA